MTRLRRIASVTLLAGMVFVGCRCDETPAALAPITVSDEPGAAAEPIGPAIPGWYCTGDGESVVPPAGAFRVGATVALSGKGWEEPPDESARFISMPGVNDVARSVKDGAWLVRHRLAGGERYLVLTAKEHRFAAGTTFDAAGAQKAFDEVAANPRTALLGVRARTWGGRPAVEGVVGTPFPDAGRTIVHHMIIPTDGATGMVMTFIAPEDQYHRYLSEACAALAVAK